MAEKWRLSGTVLVACNCDWGCPCDFNARPTTGKCEGGWTWQIDRGVYGDVHLDGLCFSVYANWPGATTAKFRVTHGVTYDHSGQYMALGPFEYASR